MSTAFTDAAARAAAGADPHHEARALVALMTDSEKLGCLDGDAPLWPGLFDMTAGGYYRHAWPAAVVERLGIPGIHFADGPRGCVIGDATAFPVSMARGASFDPDLEERIGEAIGAELRASGATFTGAVCMNLLRHPAWGRAQETYGEDPHHVGAMAAAFTRGLQRHVMACMKHFALNSMENARFSVDVTVDERALHEVYLPHFRRVAAEGVASVMSAYNSVNGEWCGENRTLLTEILRDEWGWDGVVISDFIFGLRDAVASVHAGLDIEMPFRQQRAMRLPDAIAAGQVSMADVEASVERTVATLLRFAQVHDRAPSMDVVGSDAHRRLAREAAVASTVLLRNEAGLLPVAAPARVAVLGRLAAVRNLGDGGSSDVKSSRVVTPLDGLVAAFGAESVVHHDTDVAIVDGADLVVVVVGFTKDDEGEFVDDQGTGPLIAELFAPMDDPELGTGAHWEPPAGLTPGVVGGDERMAPGGDRASLRLSAANETLIAAAAARHDRVVVVVQGGSAVVMPWAESVAAVLVTWYSGVEGGSALADVITGAREPRGRLPFAIPVDEADLVDFDRHATEVVYDLFHGQWKLDRDGVAAHFPFGSGLGYGVAEVRRASPADDGASVQVTLGADRPTSAVVFVFAGVEASAHERPERRLVGFRRVELGDDSAQGDVELEVPIDWSALDVRLDGAWTSEPGRYVLEVGLHAHDPRSVTVIVDRGAAGSAREHTG